MSPEEPDCQVHFFECTTCRARTLYSAVGEIGVALKVRECCYEDMLRQLQHLTAAVLLVKAVRTRDLSRRVFDQVADRLATHADPKMREAARDYRNKRHAPDDPNAPPPAVPDGMPS